MNATQIDEFFMFCEPTSKNIEFLAKILIHIKKNDALKIKFEPCYTLVYNWCKLNDSHELKYVKNNIIKYITNNLIIIDQKNQKMFSDVFSYLIYCDPSWNNQINQTKITVTKRRNHIKIILNYYCIKHNISNDTLNIIYQYI